MKNVLKMSNPNVLPTLLHRYIHTYKKQKKMLTTLFLSRCNNYTSNTFLLKKIRLHFKKNSFLQKVGVTFCRIKCQQLFNWNKKETDGNYIPILSLIL